MHPDQMYQLRQLGHSDLRMETEQARIRRELTSSRAAWQRSRLATWLRHLAPAGRMPSPSSARRE